MLRTVRAKEFAKFEPSLSVAEIKAANAGKKTTLSLRAMPIPISTEEIGFVAVKFALDDGTLPVLLLDRIAANALLTALQTANEIDWKTAAVKPGPARH